MCKDCIWVVQRTRHLCQGNEFGTPSINLENSVFLDDILVRGTTIEEHLANLEQVFQGVSIEVLKMCTFQGIKAIPVNSCKPTGIGNWSTTFKTNERLTYSDLYRRCGENPRIRQLS